MQISMHTKHANKHANTVTIFPAVHMLWLVQMHNSMTDLGKGRLNISSGHHLTTGLEL